ncbi:ATP-binding cassette domain-containing protein [Seonamhaeicola aphaedonensis]|uniref:Molybdate transport system ATP-binding protein n=1 Tax=Seonamhaeicola aphaedonensis TaxID=1461338 RepID=A0A3D9HJF2_9FLAO|nr:ATP-binding cassette domain-containing protein [Seonamhaeicola aphaedonensis]RED49574.1 molybdate transport system ATP-binding protein [Seonamhaeicola aphaedonensis]
MNTHIAIYISNKDDKKSLIKNILSGNLIESINGLKGALFSEITINKFIEEEKRHGRFNIPTKNGHSLMKSSEGERKKALIKYLIAENPEYLIADNIFGNLDIKSQEEIVLTLEELSKSIPIIQISNRKKDLLPFINVIYKPEGKQIVPFEDFDSLSPKSKQYFIQDLPQPLEQILVESYYLVKFQNVSVSYLNKPIIKDICWEIKTGEFWHLMGPNGSGKSTILSLISGDNPKAFNQDIYLFGVKKGSGESVWDIKKKIGYFTSEMLQGFRRSDTIERMIISGFYDSIGLYKYPNENQISKAHEWLKLLNMFDIKNRNFQTLSSGHKRLVLIARAMVKHPPLLILDEPTNGLDDSDTIIFSELVNKIAKESSTAILFVSHRHEVGLSPDNIYELIPNEKGSSGRVVK